MSKNKIEKISHKKIFSLLFFCITFLIYSTCFMFKNGGITYYSVVGAFVKILPSCIAVGALGYLMGIILDTPKKIKPKYDRTAIDKLVKQVSAERPIPTNIQEKLPSVAEEFNITVDTEADI